MMKINRASYASSRDWKLRLKPFKKWVKAKWNNNRINLLILLSFLAFAFGFAGFYLMSSPSSDVNSFLTFLNANSSTIGMMAPLDLIYPTLKLFWFFTSEKVSAVNLSLEIGRYLALLIGSYVTWRIIYGIFYEQIKSFTLKHFTKDHVIICGFNEWALMMAEKFYDGGVEGGDVVLIVNEIGSRDRERCIDSGAIVLVGDPTNKEQLKRANIWKAKYLISLLPDDGDNVTVALNAQTMKADRSGSQKFINDLRCLIHIKDSDVRDLLCQYCHSIIINSRIFQVEFFNMDFIEAGMIVEKFEPYNPEIPGEPHVIVIGLNDLGKSVALHAALEWDYKVFQVREKNKKSKLQITMVDKDASRKAEALKSLHPHLSDYCVFNPIDMDIEPHAFLNTKCQVNFNPNLTRIYLCYDDCSKAVSTALALSEKTGENLPMVVCLNKNSGLATLLRKINGTEIKPDKISKKNEDLSEIKEISTKPSASTIEVLEPKDVIGRPFQILEHSDYERMASFIARLFHNDYVERQKKRGVVLGQNLSMSSWENLPVSLQDSNLSLAYDIDTKLEMIGCIKKPLGDEFNPVISFTKNEIKHLAVEEHKRWFDERVRQGWTFAKEKDIFRKKSNYLVSWDELDEDIQKYDLEAVESIPKMLSSVGYGIARKTDMIRIGVTGHRPDRIKDVKLVLRSIHEVLSDIHRIPQDSNSQSAGLQRSYTVVSMLAEGADRLVVEEAFLWGKKNRVNVFLDAVLPFDEKEYTGDFSEKSRKEFSGLLKSSRFKTTFDCRNGKDDAYQEAGYYVAATSDYLIVIWDENKGHGKGGTADIAKYGRDKGIPGYIINSETGKIEALQKANVWEKI